VTETVSGAQTETITGALDLTANGGITINTPATVTFIANGGLDIIVPGGTTTVDNRWFNSGPEKKGMTGCRLGKTGTKLSIIAAFLQSYTLSKSEVCKMQIAACGAAREDNGMCEEVFGQWFEALGLKTNSDTAAADA
jgi:hypothetical protein